VNTGTINRGICHLGMLVGVFLLLGVGSAFADTVTLENTFQSGNVADTGKYGWIYVMPYTLQDGSSTYLVACDTFYLESTTGNSYTAAVSTGGNLSQTLFVGDAGATQDYTEAAWLFSLFSPTTSSQEDSDINFAIWALFAGDQGVTFNQFITDAGPGWTAGASSLLASANTWYTNATASQQTQYLDGLTVFTPTNGSTQQEFITYTPVPEASTLILLTIGLLGSLVFFRKKALI
jgi:hypothetical protein